MAGRRNLIVRSGRQLVVARPLEEAQKAFLSENTRRAYVRDWMDFFRVDDISKVGLERIRAVTPGEVADFRDQLLAKGLSPGTVSRKLSSLRSFFDRLILTRTIDLNPAHSKLVRAPKRGQIKKMDYLAPVEVRRLLRSIDRSTLLGRRDYALIMTDLHMGLRRSEALRIRVDQFKTMDDRACVTFRSKGEKERIVWINRDLEEALRVYSADRDTESPWLFPGRKDKPLSGDQFWRIMQKYLKAAGIKKKVGTHGLRATFITINIEKGTPLPEIQRTVGHSRPETTLGYARDLEMVKSMAPRAMEGLNADSSELS
jgi:site-specific recombinase XerD